MKEKAIIAISCLNYIPVQSEQFQRKYSHPLPRVVMPDCETAFTPHTRQLSLLHESTLAPR